MRKGLFLSRHQGEISRTVNVDELAGSYTEVAVKKVYDHFFEPAELRDMLHYVREHKLEGVVLAGYSAYFMETSKEGRSLVDALKAHGVNPNRIAFTNIYEKVALTHPEHPGEATQKAHLLIDTALAKIEYCHDVTTIAVRPRRTVLVMGTTAAGLLAASELLSNNLEVILVDKTVSWRIAYPRDETFAALCNHIESSPNAKIFFGSDLADLSGWTGDYKIILRTPVGKREVSVGGMLLCLGNDAQWIADLQSRMRLETDSEGYLLNVTGVRSSGETSDPGIWFTAPAGTSNGLKPKSTGVQRAVIALSELLARAQIEHPLLVSEVNETVCGGCGTCIKTCAFAASNIDVGKKISIIDPQRCRGCGNCVTACPTSARDLVAFPTLYVHRAIEILGQGVCVNGDPKILAFLCKNSGSIAADNFGKQAQKEAGPSYSSNVLPLPMECGGNIDTVYLLKAFKEGFDGVALVVCKDHHCRNLVGNTDMERRVGLLRAVLRSRRMDDNRMRIIHVCGHEGQRLNEELRNFSEELSRLNAAMQ